MSNKVQTLEGQWYALDAQYLVKHPWMLGAIYQSVLRNQLAHEFGVAWEPIVKGQAEMLGMPPEVRAIFSKRSEQIERGKRCSWRLSKRDKPKPRPNGRSSDAI